MTTSEVWTTAPTLNTDIKLWVGHAGCWYDSEKEELYFYVDCIVWGQVIGKYYCQSDTRIAVCSQFEIENMYEDHPESKDH